MTGFSKHTFGNHFSHSFANILWIFYQLTKKKIMI